MGLEEAIRKGLECITVVPGVEMRNRAVLECNQYYFTGEFDYAIGVGVIPPCDIELYQSRGCKIMKVEKWVRRGCFAS